MKKLLLTLMLFTLASFGFAQVASNGDYRSLASGNWSNPATWQIRNGLNSWAVATVEPTTTNNVYIQAGHTITVDAATANSKDMNINSSGGVVLDVNILNVSGKLRAFTGSAEISAVDNAYTGTSTNTLAASMITTTAPGILKFIGGSRNITETGEWNSSGTTNDAEFALSLGAIGTLNTGIKFKNTTITSGTITTGFFIAIGSSDALTIKSGATLITSRSGATSTFVANNSTTKCGTVTVENGAALELTGSTPTMDCAVFNNNGKVNYSGATTQSFLKPGSGNTDGATSINNYYYLILSNTSTKTASNAFLVNNTLEITGSATLSATNISGNICTMANGSTIKRSTTSGTTIASASALNFGTIATDLVNVEIGSNVTSTGELTNTTAPGKIGTLKVNNGFTYTITGARSFTDLLNNGVVALIPGNSLTVNISGNISGSGTITGHPSASLNFTGSNSGSAGTLNFTNGSQFINNLTIDRTGTNASVTLGTSAAMSAVGTNQTGSLTVQNGILKLAPSVTLTVLSGNISNGTGTFNNSTYIETQNTGANVGKIILPAISVVKLIPTGSNGNYLPITLTPASSSDFSINVFNGATQDATTNGTAIADKTAIVDAIYNINRTTGSGNCDVTLGWDPSLEGSTFTTIADNQIGAAQYNSGSYGSFTGTGNNTANTVSLTGVTAFAPYSIGKNTVLPVTLTSFTAQKQSTGVQLKWNTASEQNNSHFDVQRSADGVTFSNLGKVTGAGNSSSSINYYYTDKSPTTGTNYYRLNQVDFDGKTSISKPVSVNMGFNNASMQVYASSNSLSNLNISISAEQASAGQLIIYNMGGQKVYEKAVSLTKGNNDLSISLSNTDKGVFIATYNNGSLVLKKKFVK